MTFFDGISVVTSFAAIALFVFDDSVLVVFGGIAFWAVHGKPPLLGTNKNNLTILYIKKQYPKNFIFKFPYFELAFAVNFSQEGLERLINRAWLLVELRFLLDLSFPSSSVWFLQSSLLGRCFLSLMLLDCLRV